MTHHVTVTIEDEHVHVTLDCRAPAGAPCRLTCPAGCETWSLDDQHGLVDAGHCLAVEWINEVGAMDSYDGDLAPLRDDPVHVEFNGHAWTWSYAPGGRAVTTDDQ